MRYQKGLLFLTRFLICALLLTSLPAAVQAAPPAQDPPPNLPSIDFEEVAEEGFGDRDNSGVWSMQWWRGKLYVGTSRDWFCWSQAWFALNLPVVPYPPVDPDMDCPEDPLDLQLQAEIWQYTPETQAWKRVYQAPQVEIPGHPGRFTGRDIGYRDMLLFTEPDGTEALYVAGVTAYALWPGLPPPRMLRSVDGETFAPIPMEPNTILGDLGIDQATWRDLETLNGRLYVLNGKIQGDGLLMESANPAGGNDNFRWVTEPTLRLFEIAPFNGQLYVGTADRLNGYAVLRTDAKGTPPYKFTPVVTDGAFLNPPSISVVSMQVFNGALYVGTDEPTEIIRINPDDTWDLIVGDPRDTPEGRKEPLSGMKEGFDWPLNAHMWRMAVHDGVLYVGTNDSTLRQGKTTPWREEELAWQYGYDLYRTGDGVNWEPVTIDGQGDKFQTGIRAFASTPHGLFYGTVSFWYGLKVWLGSSGTGGTGQVEERLFLPFLVESAAIRPQQAEDEIGSAGPPLEPVQTGCEGQCAADGRGTPQPILR